MVDYLIKGAGVAGLCAALALTRRGAKVRVVEIRPSLAGHASWYAGGMLAPYCERESAEEVIERRGVASLDWWDGVTDDLVTRAGTLVVANPRDGADLDRFAAMTSAHAGVAAGEISELEPDLSPRFQRGLYYKGEAHMDPRKALAALVTAIEALGGEILFSQDADYQTECAFELDCRGLKSPLQGLRGVRGEMLLLHMPEITLTRTIRLLHPRIPLYIVPRADHHFMVGATMIESAHGGPITARSMMEFLNAAYSVVPAFGEAEIVESGVGVRPAFADNLPQLQVDSQKRCLSINGYYRHGFALGPMLAEAAADWLQDQSQDEDFPVTDISHQREGAK